MRGIANVVQAVGIYRDADTARAHFDQLLPSLTACTALHAKNYDFTVRQLDTDTLSLSSSVWKLFYRVNHRCCYTLERLAFRKPNKAPNRYFRRLRTGLRNARDGAL